MFQDSDVDMPIMSVVELSENEELGTDVVFRKKDGEMVDVQFNNFKMCSPQRQLLHGVVCPEKQGK